VPKLVYVTSQLSTSRSARRQRKKLQKFLLLLDSFKKDGKKANNF
jgi:hypothetical protein